MEYNEIEERMKKTVSVYEENLAEIRAGRANPAILNKVKVDYYGVPTPINQVAGISVPEARMILIQPWDTSLLKEIEKEGEKLPYQKTEFGRAKSAMFFPLYIDNIYIGYWILESGKMHAFDDLDTTVIEGIKDNIISTLKAISYQDTIENIVRKDLFTGLNSAEYLYGQAKNIIDSQTSSAVCMFRITNIEKINETISRNMGNQIIIETSNAVKEKMYSKYIFVRYMGPKFAIVFTGVEVNSLDEFLEDLKEEIESIVLEEEIEEPEESKKKSSKATTKKKVKKNTRVASPKVNFVVTTYYKGTPIENVTKKLEEYLDNAPKSENQINYI